MHGVACELFARGHEVVVFTGHPVRGYMPDAMRYDEYQVDGIPVHRFHHSFVPMGGQSVIPEIEYNNHLAAWYFKRLAEEFKPDIVHFFHFSRLGVGLVDVVSLLNVPAFYTPTDFWAVCPLSQMLLPGGRVCHGPSCHGGNCVKHVAMLRHLRNISRVVGYIPDSSIDVFASLANKAHGLIFPFKKEVLAISNRKQFIVDRVNKLHGIVSPTQFMTNVLTDNGVKKELIVPCGYGINPPVFESPRRVRSEKYPLTISYIGTLAPHKGCLVLIQAFNKLNLSGLKLKIFGGVNEYPDYVVGLRAAAKGNESIMFCGTFQNSQISNVFSSVDILVVPSIWYENAPLVIYSALAAKCPVIASNFPGITELVCDGSNGLLFEPGNADALAECLLRLHNEPCLLQALSDNCKSPKSISAYVDELINLYITGGSSSSGNLDS